MALKDQDPTAHFLVRCPASKLPDLRHALESAQIPFRETQDQLYLNGEHVLDGIFTGGQSEEFTRELNQHLAQEGYSQQLIDFELMTCAERHSLLVFVNTSVCWLQEFNFTVDEIDPDDLKEFIKGNPTLFAPEQQSPA